MLSSTQGVFLMSVSSAHDLEQPWAASVRRCCLFAAQRSGFVFFQALLVLYVFPTTKTSCLYCAFEELELSTK